MDNNDDKRQELILARLASRPDASHDAIVAQALETWEKLATHLSPLIGEAGFTALYGRAVRLVSAEHAGLAIGAPLQSVDRLLLRMHDSFAAMDADLLGQANCALLSRFSQLLAGLIGDALTTQLLKTAWIAQREENDARERTK
jgi:hypothetical protein